MENIVDKLGFFDFFNAIIVGSFTIVGSFCITLQFGWDVSKKVFLYYARAQEVNVLFFVLCLFSIIVVAYILGILCHEIFDIIDDRFGTFKKIIERLFESDSCIENPVRRNRYASLATIILDNNCIESRRTRGIPSNIEWNHDLNNYFFTYCMYQVQIRGLNKKTEKLRDIEGLAKSFCVSSIILFFVLLGVGITSWNTNYLSTVVFFVEAVSLIMGSIFFCFYRKKALENRIRLTLSLYDAIYEKEKKNPVI